MRIVAGDKKGHPLSMPKGEGTRPTADRVREAIFNILGPLPKQTRVLDLFSGTGALGLEALSRGAKEASFVDQNQQACLCTKKNIVSLGFSAQSKLYHSSALDIMPKLSGPFHLIFIDPPYQSTWAEDVLVQISTTSKQLLAKDAIVVVESVAAPLKRGGSLSESYGNCLFLFDERTYGQTGIFFYQYRGT